MPKFMTIQEIINTPIEDIVLEDVPLNEFTHLIEGLRLKHGMYRADLIEKSKIPVHRYDALIHSDGRPSDEMIEKLCKVFDLDVDAFLDRPLLPSIDDQLLVEYQPLQLRTTVPKRHQNGIMLSRSPLAKANRGYRSTVLNTVYVNTVDIYGVPVQGKIYSAYTNTVIVEDENGERHMVHKENLGDHVRVHGSRSDVRGFNRRGTERREERPVETGVRRRRRIRS